MKKLSGDLLFIFFFYYYFILFIYFLFYLFYFFFIFLLDRRMDSVTLFLSFLNLFHSLGDPLALPFDILVCVSILVYEWQ